MMPAAIKALWNYRGFILGSVKREFQAKYTNSMLGISWAIIQPLAMILVYTVIFSQIMRARLPGVESLFGYSIYLCAGIITWGYFAEVVGRAQNIFIENATLLKKLSFPRLCLPVTLVLSASLNFFIIFSLFLVFMLVTGQFPGLAFIALFPVLAIQLLFAIGLGVSLGVLNVFFRDIGQLFGVVLQFWFWLTPIVYPANILPAQLQPFMQLNPMASVIGAYQQILVHGQFPDWLSLWPTAVLSICLCLWGLHLFKKHSGELVDEL
ncbi:ABC-type polysaccharide/polyol phosphate export system, permease component [Pseudomonas sp. GM18]|uniref:ABC transporter permease n=1 Tax=Pseudomonas sp. GM18 TaxID=1144324 RepID=UPI0002725B25|nr:ABC transporter permease [Pseudomonas sp. GM18]EJM14024.1 ABC-type polysaccharide/polyol phosphate export system, permease component [Pseudomonas sp. GM18]